MEAPRTHHHILRRSALAVYLTGCGHEYCNANIQHPRAQAMMQTAKNLEATYEASNEQTDGKARSSE